ncbi:translocation/assembly module TamB domain-containing protein [Chryseolinea sp. T2]|uniref:translocation/assembly module TamB domain-containing protein n=1 Tax=Chryseolinea sp. T2 TaxID=3129255 RepID=UPI0030776A5A
MIRKWTWRKFFIKALKVVGYSLLSIVVLLIVIALAIQIPAVQNTIVEKAVSFLEKKIGTKVSLNHLSLSFPKAVVLEGLYLEDQKADTLLYLGRLSIDTDLWALTRNTIELNDVTLTDADIRIKRSAVDSAFNFDYIIKAFSTGEQPADTTASKPWTFNIEDVNLKDVRAHYLDSIVKIDTKVRLHQFDVGVDRFDLNGPSITIDDIALSDVQASYVSWQVPSDKTDSAGTGTVTLAETNPDTSSFNLSFKTIKFADVSADYRQIPQGQHARLNLGTLLVTAEEVDLIRRKLALENVELSNTFLSYQQAEGIVSPASPQASATKSNKKAKHATNRNHLHYPTQSAASKVILTAGASFADSADASNAFDLDWDISLAKLSLSNNNLQYYDFNVPLAPKGVDFRHLWLTRLSMEADGLAVSGTQVQGTIGSLEFSERSGLQLTQMQAQVRAGNTSAQLKDLIIRTANSNIEGSVNAAYRSLKTIADDYPTAKFELKLKPSVVAIDDALMFAPGALDSVPVHIPNGGVIRFHADANGMVKDISLRELGLSYMDSTEIVVGGRVTGLPHADPQFSADVKRLYTTRKEIEALLPDSLLPTGIQLPEWISLTGNAKGSAASPAAKLHLKTNLGAIRIDGKFKNLDQKTPSYDARVDIDRFDAGRLLRQAEKMGRLSAHVSARGKGFTKDNINSKVDLVIKEFQYQQYAYRDLNVHGTLVKYLFSGKAWLNDPNLNFTLDGDLDYTGDVPSYALKFDLKNADFKALHFSERPLKARGIFESNLATSDFTSINGNLDIRKFGIYNGDALYAVDSLLFVSIDQKGESKISIRSDIVSGDFEGTINLVAMPDAIRRHFNNYFSLHDTAYNRAVDVQRFKFDLVIKNTELITEILVPELEPFVPGRIEGEFDSEQHKLNLHADVSRLQYGGIGLDSLMLNVTSDENAMDYTLGLRKIRFDTLRMEALRVTGKVAHDSIRTKLLILDSLLKDKYALGGAFYSESNAIQFRFLEDEVVMNYAPWTTPADNYLRFTPKGILAHNFSITNINERISLVTHEEKEARTAIEFKDLNLQNITNIVEAKVLVDGLINGDFMLSGEGSFETALTVKELEILGVEWGDLALKLAHENTGKYLVDLGINGINMEFGVKGNYVPDSIASKIDLTADISRINLVAVEPLTGGQLKNSSGSITGEMTLKGSPTAPEIRGFLSFQKASVVPSFVNTKFLLQDERIAFTADGVVLENFRILDEQNNAATIKGILKTKDYATFNMDLRLDAKNFQLLNTQPDEKNAQVPNELFYGKVGINTTATIVGTFTEPKIDMNIDLNDDSKFTYVIPQSEKGVLEQKGIVVFKDKDAAKDPFLRSIEAKDSVGSRFTGIDLTANIEIDDKEELGIVIDPVTGDKLAVKGNSTLTFAMNPTGEMTLTGRYEITSGTYDFTFYRLLKRNFKIEKGSSITWAGDPLEANMDIKASYLVETSPLELMSNQVTSDEQRNNLRQRLPFLVYLNIDGELMTPEISFQLDMPEQKRSAAAGAPYARIQDINTRESDVNKQVFALLILKRFVADDVFDNQSGGSVEATARRSVSKLLSEQLNRMSENIKGIELTFDVRSDEDYSTGEAQGQTSVQLGVQKTLLDDRLIVKVSGNVDIEGNKSNQSSFSDYIGDLALEYKLTPDGRLRITGFRNSDFDIISGELIETGAGLIYIKDYDKVKDLFKANAKKK